MLPMKHEIDRRTFLVTTGLTALASTRVLGANDTLLVGAIGTGGRMNDLLNAADKAGNYQLAAVCDVYAPRRDAMKERSKGLAAVHTDYRELLEQKLDAVIIASPDYLHVRMAVDGLAAGKDVYLEKPVTHTLEEGATLTRAVRSSKQILQCGMQQRSWSHFRAAVDLIQGGSLGRVPQVRTYWWQNYRAWREPKAVDVKADSFRDGTIDHMQNFFDCVRSRKEPNAPVETGVAAARAGHIANLAYHRGGQLAWPLKP